MKSKLLKMLLLAGMSCTLLFSGVVLAACGPEPDGPINPDNSGNTETPPSKCSHNWREKHEDATCTTDGYTMTVCSKCGEEKDKVVIDKIGHDWEYDSVPATCISAGYSVSVCKNCQEEKDREVLPATNQHTFEYDEDKVDETPTCTKEGSVLATCSVCKVTQERIKIPALGHIYDEDPENCTIQREPTCTEEGLATYHCARCHKPEGDSEKPIPATGHRFASGVEECLNGCGTKNEGMIVYRVYVNRMNGQRFGSPTVTLINKEGTPVAQGNVNSESKAYFEAKLDVDAYTVKLSNVMEGFEYESSYSTEDGIISVINGNMVSELDIRLTSHASGTTFSGNGYGVGSIVPDFTFTTVVDGAENGGKTYHLSDLFKTKQLVLVNMFFNTCGPCLQERKDIARACEAFKDYVAVICLATPSRQSMADTKDSREIFEYPDWFHIVYDNQGLISGLGAILSNGTENFPTNMIIDSGYYVFYKGKGGLSESELKSLFRTNIVKASNETETANLEIPVAVLPERKELFA